MLEQDRDNLLNKYSKQKCFRDGTNIFKLNSGNRRSLRTKTQQVNKEFYKIQGTTIQPNHFDDLKFLENMKYARQKILQQKVLKIEKGKNKRSQSVYGYADKVKNKNQKHLSDYPIQLQLVKNPKESKSNFILNNKANKNYLLFASDNQIDIRKIKQSKINSLLEIRQQSKLTNTKESEILCDQSKYKKRKDKSLSTKKYRYNTIDSQLSKDFQKDFVLRFQSYKKCFKNISKYRQKIELDKQEKTSISKKPQQNLVLPGVNRKEKQNHIQKRSVYRKKQQGCIGMKMQLLDASQDPKKSMRKMKKDLSGKLQKKVALDKSSHNQKITGWELNETKRNQFW